MKYLSNNSLARLLIAIIALVFLTIGVVTIATMDHDGMMTSNNCPISSQSSGDCTQPEESAVCVDYHLAVIQNLSSALPQGFGLQLLGMMMTVLALVIFGSTDKLFRFYARLRSRYRQLRENTLGIFQDQLGYWLAIIQKKDPSYALALA